jgi:peptidoglycan hydrolase-like protein with peptidoglycan-binding domain
MCITKKLIRFLCWGVIFCFIMTGSVSTLFAAQDPGAPKTPKKAEKLAPNKDILSVQQALNKSGYQVKEDGFMGPKTRSALKEFQKKNGLKPTAKIDKPTLGKLGIKQE